MGINENPGKTAKTGLYVAGTETENKNQDEAIMGIDWQKYWQEIVGYLIGFFSWLYGKMPDTCEEWTDLVAFLIVAVTFIFITMPKAWDFQIQRWRKKRDVEGDSRG